jgi:hypothetical protein
VSNVRVFSAPVIRGEKDECEDNQDGCHEPQRAEGVSNHALGGVAHSHDGQGAENNEPAQPHLVALAGAQRLSRGGAKGVAEPRAENSGDVAPKIDHDGNFRPNLGDRGEGGSWVGGRGQELPGNPEVRTG